MDRTMRMSIPHSRRRMATPPSDRAFVLLEVLIAMAIFTFGMVAVAAMFPIAARIQRETFDDLISQQVAQNAVAQIQARPFYFGSGTPDFGTNAPYYTTPVPLTDFRVYPPSADTILADWWKLEDRSWPSSDVYSGRKQDPLNDSVSYEAATKTYYWIPFVQRARIVQGNDREGWVAHIFVLRKGQDAEYGPGTFDNQNVSGDDLIDQSGETWPMAIDSLLPYVVGFASENDPRFVPRILGLRIRTLFDAGFSGDAYQFEVVLSTSPTTPADLDTNNNLVPDLFVIGDRLLDEYGHTYIVRDVEATSASNLITVDRRIRASPADNSVGPTIMWYAPPPTEEPADPSGPEPRYQERRRSPALTIISAPFTP